MGFLLSQRNGEARFDGAEGVEQQGNGLRLRIGGTALFGVTRAVSARGYDEFRKADCLFVYSDKNSFRTSLQELLQALEEGRLDKATIKNTYTSIFSFEAGVRRLRDILTDNKLF